jgi:hypothetical protein
MDTSSYLERFLRYGISLEEAKRNLERILVFEHWLEKRGNSLDGASMREMRTYLKRLIRRDENSIGDLLSLLIYYESSNRVDLELYLSNIVNGAADIDDILLRVAEIAGDETVRAIEREVPQPPLGTDPARLPAYTARLIRRMMTLLSESDVRRVLDGFREGLVPLRFESDRVLYKGCESLDEFLHASAQREIQEIRKYQHSNSKWKAMFFPDEYVNRAVLFQEMLSAVHRDDRLYVTLQPYLPSFYLNADSPEKRRYYACSDSYVRGSFLTGKPTIPAIWCERCVSQCRRHYEYVIGRPLQAEIVECALLGDTSCRIAIYLGTE